MIIKYSPELFASLKKFNVRIRKNFKQRILIFAKNPSEPELHNHPLRDKWEGYSSINITADYRAIYKEINKGREHVAYFVALGTHKELYG